MARIVRSAAWFAFVSVSTGLVAACAGGRLPGGWGSTYGQGYSAGCNSGRAEAGWASAFRIDPPSYANAEFREGWRLGYEQCLAAALDDPRPSRGPGR